MVNSHNGPYVKWRKQREDGIPNVVTELLAERKLLSLSAMRKLLTYSFIAITLFASLVTTQAQDNNEALAILVPGSGTYSRSISTDTTLTQQFFDQGLRLAWSFYFPEAIASYQEASRHDSDHPMPYFGLAHAIGPNPNSRYQGLPDDPQT